MSLRYHEISEAYHQILNPFTEEKLMLIGEICRLNPEVRLLDLACGKGEMLCQWAQKYGIHGVGVDISTVFLGAAKERAAELSLEDNLTFVLGDAGEYPKTAEQFDIVSCIGATWVGKGLVGTLELMKPIVKPNGTILVGEPFWIEPPPEGVYEAMRISKDEFTSLEGTLDRFESAGLNLVEMVLADQDSWDRYEGPQWLAVDDYLIKNPDDPEASELKAWIDRNRRNYLKYSRRYFGWGIFVLRPNS